MSSPKSCILSLVVGLALGGGMLAGALTWWKGDASATPAMRTHHEDAVSVLAYTVSSDSAGGTLQAIGRVEAPEGEPVVVPLGGRILDVLAKEGQTLSKNAPLMTFDDSSARMEYQSLQLELGQAQAQMQQILTMSMTGTANPGSDVPSPAQRQALARLVRRLDRVESRANSLVAQQVENDPLGGRKRLSTYQESLSEATEIDPGERLAPRATSPQDDEGAEMAEPAAQKSPLAEAQDRYKALTARMQELQATINAQQTLMPQDGRVVLLIGKPGDVVAPGDPVARVALAGSVDVRASIPKRLRKALTEGMAVSVSAPGDTTGAKVEGKVLRVAPPENAAADRVWVRIHVDRSPPGLLAVNKTVDVTFTNLEGVRQRGALTIPRRALHGDDTGHNVYVIETIGNESRVMVRAVSLGAVDKDKVVIRSGLSDGERIVLEGPPLLKQRQQVSIVEPNALDAPNNPSNKEFNAF